MALRVGFIGLGNQGKPIAAHLAPAGFETWVFDLAAAPVAELVTGGAKAAKSARQVGEQADLICVCVPGDAEVHSVLLGEHGVLAGAAPGALIAIHSTVLPETVLAMAAAAEEREVSLIDACVTGGAARAVRKELSYLVGGEADALERARPVLECSSERIIHAGPLGHGARLKLCINLVTYIQWAAAYESFSLARAVGLPEEILEEAGRANGQITPLMSAFLASHKAPEAARRSEGMQKIMRGFMQVAEKDLACVLELARRSEVTLPVTGLVSQLMARLYGVEDPGRR